MPRAEVHVNNTRDPHCGSGDLYHKLFEPFDKHTAETLEATGQCFRVVAGI